MTLAAWTGHDLSTDHALSQHIGELAALLAGITFLLVLQNNVATIIRVAENLGESFEVSRFLLAIRPGNDHLDL